MLINWKIVKKKGGVLNLLTMSEGGKVVRYYATLTPPNKNIWNELGIKEINGK